jgi:hypothetical protein
MTSKPSLTGSRATPRKPCDHGGKSQIERGYDHRWVKLRLVVLSCDNHLCKPCCRDKTLADQGKRVRRRPDVTGWPVD